MTQKERQARSRQEIFLAAMTEFSTYPYDEVTMERICTRHGISKGMMYHYYSNKDQLFLLCAEKTCAALEAFLARELPTLDGLHVMELMKGYFLLREQFFQLHPSDRNIFESAVIHTPKHLQHEVEQLRAPIQALNMRFLGEIVSHLTLREGVDAAHAVRYLEQSESVFRVLLIQEQEVHGTADPFVLTKAAEQILDLILFGVAQRA